MPAEVQIRYQISLFISGGSIELEALGAKHRNELTPVLHQHVNVTDATQLNSTKLAAAGYLANQSVFFSTQDGMEL
jgi:hypothetical protein